MELPLVQKLKARGLLGDDVSTKTAVGISVQIRASEQGKDEDDLAARLVELANVVLEAVGDGKIRFYEFWAIGLAFSHVLARARDKAQAQDLAGEVGAKAAGLPENAEEKEPEPPKRTRKKK